MKRSEAQNRATIKYNLKKKYGLTVKQYNRMYRSQGGYCAICDEHERDCGKLVVDHDHITGRVRGLLCNFCNIRLGLIEKSMDVNKMLTFIHLYIKSPPAQENGDIILYDQNWKNNK